MSGKISTDWQNGIKPLLHCTLAAVQCIVIGPVCGGVCLWVCGWVC